jgi:AraC-like DNA-binding protein
MKNVMTAFKEYKEFKKRRPWDVNTLRFPSGSTTPPHYAETIEILLCCDIKGTAYIGGNRYELEGKQAFFIAPNVIHSIQYLQSEGHVIVVKLHPDGLLPLINLQNILAESDMDFGVLSCHLPEYDRLVVLAEQLRTSSSGTPNTLCVILSIFEILQQYSSTSEAMQPHIPTYDDPLREIISWTEQHFAEKISLEEVASMVGYNKHYFCNKFKAATGETYLQYLNNLRVFHACKMLKKGHALTEICEKCGFENMSYFIQLFKKIVGTTPKQYALDVQKR